MPANSDEGSRGGAHEPMTCQSFPLEAIRNKSGNGLKTSWSIVRSLRKSKMDGTAIPFRKRTCAEAERPGQRESCSPRFRLA